MPNSSVIEDVELRTGTSALSARVSHGSRTELPLVVAIHGAGYDARYFAATEQSVHEIGARRGFRVISITRPGYPAHADSAPAQPDLAISADLVAGSIDDAWRRWGGERPGVVVLGHSVGAAVTVHLAARRATRVPDSGFPLLGVAISGVGDVPAPGPLAAFSAMPRSLVLDLPFAQCRPSFYGPDQTFDARWLGDFADLLVPFPAADVIEVNTEWPCDLDGLAAKVNVPVHYVLAEHDALWVVDDERVAAFARRFTASPRVEAGLWPGAGHNIEHHLAGPNYVQSVLDFAARCGGSHP